MTSKLLFNSGFEGITLNAASGGWQALSGVDSGTGFSWGAPDVWGGIGHLQVLDGSFVNQIQTVTGHNGTATHALYQSVTGASATDAQDPLMFTPTATTLAQEGDLYTSEWIKFQPDLATQLFAGQDASGNWGNWRAVFEWKTGGQGANYGGDYRIKVSVAMDNSGHLFWSSAGDNNANGPYPFQTFWQTDNHTVPVAAGQWFHLETYTHRSTGAGGEFWAKVDGQTIVDHLGSNVGVADAPINRIMLAQDYTGGHLPASQWVDDAQIWDGLPSTAPVTTPPPVVPPIVSGTSAAFTLPTGAAATHVLYGTSSMATLNGTTGNDHLDSMSYTHKLVGGNGDDIYVVHTAADVVVEAAGGGIDTVHALASTYTLAANVENLGLYGAYNHTATGNALNNLITASATGNDTINAGAGNDIIQAGNGAAVLTGGAGHDMFAFSTMAAGAAGTKVTDFHLSDDMLDLRPLLKAAGYAGTNPIADHTIALVSDGAGGTEVAVDPHHTGTMHNLVDLQHVALGSVHVGTDLLWH